MLAFIIPYRDREKDLEFFDNHMKNIVLEGKKEFVDYLLYYIHQNDERPFNRGAMKNIGFLFLKEKYPEKYKSMTIIFNDIDTMPLYKNTIDYNTIQGVVKHHFGYNHCLGGIVSINALDFETINGFPNLWSWGTEDVSLYKRCLKNNYNVDRTHFTFLFSIHNNVVADKFIVRSSCNNKLYSKIEMDKFSCFNNNINGIIDIKNLNYKEENNMIHINNFDTKYPHSNFDDMLWHDISKTGRGEIMDKLFTGINESKISLDNFFNLLESNVSKNNSNDINMLSNYKIDNVLKLKKFNDNNKNNMPKVGKSSNSNNSLFNFSFEQKM
jgi:hypothetical protein